MPITIKIYLHRLYWILAFFQGIIELLGLPSWLFKVGMPIVLILLLFDRIIHSKTFISKGLLVYLSFFLISIISGLINNIDFFSTIYFLRFVSLHYLYFLVVINDKNLIVFSKIYRLLIILFLVQLPAALIKVVTVGPIEEIIGTLSTLSGSLSTTIPAFASILLMVYWLDKRKNIFLLLILLFFGFGLAGGKRAIIFIIPVLLFITYILYVSFSKFKGKFLLLRKSILIFLVGLLVIYITARINPSLNKENKIGGSFNVDYIVNYTTDYATSAKTRTIGDIPRIEALGYFWLLQSKKGWFSVLFGDGAGKLVISSFNKNKGKNPMVEYYNIFYGGRMGAIWLFLQVGLLGLIFYLILYFKILRYVLKDKLTAGERSIVYSVTLLFLFDSFYYSKTFIYYQALIGVFFWYLAYLKIKNKSKRYSKQIRVNESTPHNK